MQLSCGAPSHRMLQFTWIQGLPEQVNGRHLIKSIKYINAISVSCELKLPGDCENNLGHDLHMLTLTL